MISNEMNVNFRAIICDDEAGIRLLIRKKLQKTEGFEVVGEAENGVEAMELFDAVSPDVVFLDVDMPLKGGIECAREMQDKKPDCILIFATGHEEYMGEAFEVYAFDYLVKPFNMERLDATLDRIKKIRRPGEGKNGILVPRRAGKQSRMMLRHKDGITFIDPEDVLLIQREERATVMYLAGGARYVVPETLTELEDKLDSEIFFRCHKSYIVNINRIKSITPYGRWTYVVQLEGTERDALITYEKYEELERRFS